MDSEKEALHIQAAAVAAQQAALFEEETGLRERRTTLDRQEAQLAAHLDEKRRRLLEFRDQILATRTQMLNERAQYERRVAEMTRQLEMTRAEIIAGQRQARIDRRRLFKLRQRLKQRLHRYWIAERAAMESREAALQAEWQRLSSDNESFQQSRQRISGEMEVQRRQLQDEWSHFRQERERWNRESRQARKELAESAKNLAQRETVLVEQQRQEAATRQRLEKEAVGLENRIHHLRCQLLEEKQNQASGNLASVTGPVEETVTDDYVNVAASPAVPFLPGMDSFSDQLADQRIHLVEQWQRLVQMQMQWQQQREEQQTELRDILQQLQIREQSLESDQERYDKAQDKTRQQGCYLDGRQAILTAQTAAWVSERDRQQADLEVRQEFLDRQLSSLKELRQVWHERHRQAVIRLREMFELREKWRSEFTLLRSQWFDRFSALEQESHKAAQRTLALEQYRQKILAKVQNPHDAKQRLDRMQQRWEAHFHLASSELAGHRQSMRREMHQLEERYRYLHQWAEALANREAILADREKALEIDEVLAQSDASRQDQELQHLRAQCAIYEQQMADLREEVERLACRMLEEGNPADQYLEKAA